MQGHRGTPAHARQGGMGAPGGKVRSCMQYRVGGRRGAGAQGCLGNRAPGRRGARVCVHRDVARSTTGAQKCICFFFKKKPAHLIENEPCRPQAAQRAGLHWLLPPAMASTSGLGPHHPSPSFFLKKKSVCAQRCSTQCTRSTTRAQKCICFFLQKTSAFYRKMNPAGPGWRSGRGCIGFCRQPWLPLPD